jgi:hypothetical protein
MARKLLSPADIPAIEYKCVCGGDAKDCRYALLCEYCRHPCKKEAPVMEQAGPQKKLRAQIDYAKFRRRHRHCFDCIYCNAVFMGVACTNIEMKDKLGGK